MRATVERADLFRSLTHVHRVVERRNTIPILSNVLIRAEEGGLLLKATDLDMEIVDRVPAMVEASGATTVPAHMLHDIVRKFADGAQVALETQSDGATLSVASGRSRFALQMLPEADYPDIAVGEMTHGFTIAAKDLRLLIDRTQFAISTEETRYYLNGIYLHAVESEGGTMLRAVATDGHRLAEAEIPAPDGAAGMPGIILPRKTVGEVQRLLEDPDTEVRVDLSDAKIRVAFGDVVLTSKLIDGTFPDYGRVIPQNNEIVLKVEREAFTAAVDRVSTISSERGRAVKLTLSSEKLVLTVVNPDSGTATEELVVEYDAAPLEIGFNARYLLDITAQLSAENATFRLADPGAPTLVQGEGETNTLYVLMPMRV
jgi:DNA polymerase-3 subunit beta